MGVNGNTAGIGSSRVGDVAPRGVRLTPECPFGGVELMGADGTRLWVKRGETTVIAAKDWPAVETLIQRAENGRWIEEVIGQLLTG